MSHDEEQGRSMNDPIATFWTVIAGAATYAILGSTIISVIYLIAESIAH